MIRLYNTATNDRIFVKFSTFPDGTRHVKIIDDIPDKGVTIEAQVSKSDDILDILLLKDAIDNINRVEVVLYMPYVLGTRQDRYINYGEPLSVKVYGNMINAAKFKAVLIFDPHSVATTTVLDNVISLPLDSFFDLIGVNSKKSVVVAPDAGAVNRARDFANYKKIPSLVESGKSRNLETGEILSLNLIDDEGMDGKDIYVIDDVVTSGGTALRLLEEIRKKYTPRSISFVVTHADSSEAIDKMCVNFDKVYVTNSKRKFNEHENLVIKNLFSA